MQWFADRADVIYCFRPGQARTTAETLSVLTNALSGCDHKLHIILNKADGLRRSTTSRGPTGRCAGTVRLFRGRTYLGFTDVYSSRRR